MTLTHSERAHEAFFRKMEEEGIQIECTTSPVGHVAYFKGQEEGPTGRGRTAEDAYLDLIDSV